MIQQRYFRPDGRISFKYVENEKKKRKYFTRSILYPIRNHISNKTIKYSPTKLFTPTRAHHFNAEIGSKIIQKLEAETAWRKSFKQNSTSNGTIIAKCFQRKMMSTCTKNTSFEIKFTYVINELTGNCRITFFNCESVVIVRDTPANCTQIEFKIATCTHHTGRNRMKHILMYK